MNADEFEKYLVTDVIGYPYETDRYESWSYLQSTLDHLDITNIRVVDSNDHEEGNYHTSLYTVIEFDDGYTTHYYKKTGYYQSYDGEYWDGAFVKVEPQTKTVTIWSDAQPEFDNSFGGLGWNN